MSRGEDALRDAGYRVTADVHTRDDDFDGQGHLNNAAIARLFNDLRVRYVYETVGRFWIDLIREERYVVAARELHVRYESEGLPGESFLGGTRYLRWDGKAAILEQCIVESATGRSVASAWLVQLLAQDGKAVEWPDSYLERVSTIEGRAMERRPGRRDHSFGPPP